MALRTKNKALLCKAENINHAHLRYLARDPPHTICHSRCCKFPGSYLIAGPLNLYNAGANEGSFFGTSS